MTVTGSSENATQSLKEGLQDISEDETITAKHDFSFHMIMFSLVVVVENKGAQFGNPAKDDQLARAIEFLNGKLAQLSTDNGGT